MKILPIRNIKLNPKQRAKTIISKVPRKVTLDNLPVVAGTVGLLTPIPFASVTLFALGKAVQIIIKKTLHKP